MSFFDTLKSAGLWPQQGQGQPQDNPYGLDPAMMRQARMASLGNIGAQILAASMKQTSGQRANVMSNADWTGGYRQNLLNAAQMKLMGDKRRQETESDARTEAARKWLGDRIQSMPDGLQKRNAMIYLQLGDIQKAADAITGGSAPPSALQEKVGMLEQSGVSHEVAVGIATGRYHVTTDPFTNTQRITDLGGQAINPQSGPATTGPAASPESGPPVASPPPGGVVSPDQFSAGTVGVDARNAGEKAVVSRNVGLRTGAEGAISFLTKVGQVEGRMGDMTDTDFGPMQGERDSPYVGTANTAWKGIMDWGFGDNSLGRQDRYRRDMADLELDVAKMKLKGDGPITDNERELARRTLGGLTVADKATSTANLTATKVEAATKIRDAVQAGVMTLDDLRAAGIDPVAVAKILEGAGVAGNTGGAPAVSSSPNIKIRQIN